MINDFPPYVSMNKYIEDLEENLLHISFCSKELLITSVTVSFQFIDSWYTWIQTLTVKPIFFLQHNLKLKHLLHFTKSQFWSKRNWILSSPCLSVKVVYLCYSDCRYRQVKNKQLFFFLSLTFTNIIPHLSWKGIFSFHSHSEEC